MASRAGVTKKLSVSVHEDDVRLLERRAKRMYGGNVSAVFAELIATVRRQEAWRKAVALYGRPIVVTDEEREAIDRELLGEAPQAPTRRRRAKR